MVLIRLEQQHQILWIFIFYYQIVRLLIFYQGYIEFFIGRNSNSKDILLK